MVCRQPDEAGLSEGEGGDREPECRTYHRLKWLTLCRLVFSILLLGSTVFTPAG